MSEPQGQSIIDTILELKNRAPFEPFRIVSTSGDKYLVESGDNLVKLESQFFYGYPRSDKFVFMRLNQIASIEQFGNENGSRKKDERPEKNGRRRRK